MIDFSFRQAVLDVVATVEAEDDPDDDEEDEEDDPAKVGEVEDEDADDVDSLTLLVVVVVLVMRNVTSNGIDVAKPMIRMVIEVVQITQQTPPPADSISCLNTEWATV